MEIELRIRGEQSEIEGILAAIRRVSVPRDYVQAFVDECTVPMLQTLNAISYDSLNDRPTRREALVLQAGLRDDGDLNGVMGSIGRAWAKHTRERNPFLGVSSPTGVIYRIDHDLAIDVSMKVAVRLAMLSGPTTS